MTSARPGHDDGSLTGDSEATLRNEIEDLRAALDAIRTGGVDVVMIPSPHGDMLYTLTSADRPYRVIVEEMGEGAATISERGILLYANQRFADLLRRDRRSLIGRDLTDVLRVGDPTVLPGLLAAPPGATTYAELDLTADDGSASPVLASVSGLDLDGVVVRCLVIADLTHRKRVEEQLADANTRLSRTKTDLEEAQRVAHLGSWLWDRRSGRVRWSPEMCAIFGIEVTDDALAWPDVLAVRSPPEDAMELMARLHDVARDGGSFELSQRLLLPDGSVRQALTRGEAVRDDTGAVTGVRGTMQDVTSLRLAEVALAQSTAQFVAAFEYAPVGMAVVGLDRTILSANRTLGEITGYDVGQLTRMRLDELMDPRDAQAEAGPLTDVVAGRVDEYRSELRLIRADGARRWVSFSVARIGEAGKGTQAVLHVEDITDRKGYESGLVYLADHDPLTGLANRRRFREDLEHYLTLATRARVNGALLLLDLDNFKDINDTFGHPAGDGLLCSIADVFRTRVRQSDVIARLGGDEFAILLWAVDLDGATTAAQEVLDAVRDVRFDLAGQRVRTTASAGLVMLDGTGGRTADEVISNADLTMYAAKDRGRDGLVVFEPHGVAAAQSRARFHWTDQIHRALDEGLFTLLTQPILDLRSGQITGCELLLRMRQDGQLVAPEEFLGIAERHGLAAAIDTHVVRIGTDLAARHRQPPGFRWEINISASSLGDPDLPAVIEAELAAKHLAPESFVFEITETAAITNVTRALAFAGRVSDLGCGFALDDFGAGYGSFYYLKHLPCDYLKIDGEFIRDLRTNRANQIIVQALVSAARGLRKQTIAEYVADQRTLNLVRDFGVDHAQGYYIGRPTDPSTPFRSGVASQPGGS